MTFDPLRNGRSNRDRRDQAFARSVIAEAMKRHNEQHAFVADKQEPTRVRYGQEDIDHCSVCGQSENRPCHTPCNDPACPTHGIAASNARQNDYWQRVGGHSDAGEVDVDPDRCPMCNDLLSGNCEVRDEHYPYCSARCSVEASEDES